MHELVNGLLLAMCLAWFGHLMRLWEHFRIFPGRVVRAQPDSLPVNSETDMFQIFTDDNLEIKKITQTERGQLFEFFGFAGLYKANSFDPV